jgi:hypothetical protein
MKALLLGVAEGKDRDVDIHANVNNPIAMERALRLATYAELTMGHHTPPQSILDARSRELAASGSSNGSRARSPNGYESSWARAVENPATDQD